MGADPIREQRTTYRVVIEVSPSELERRHQMPPSEHRIVTVSAPDRESAAKALRLPAGEKVIACLAPGETFTPTGAYPPAAGEPAADPAPPVEAPAPAIADETSEPSAPPVADITPEPEPETDPAPSSPPSGPARHWWPR